MVTPSDNELLPAAEEKEDSLCASAISECQLSPNATPPELSLWSTSAFGESTTATPPEPSPGFTSASTHTVSESSLLPLVGPYNLGAIKIRGILLDGDKYDVLNQLDQPQQYNFPAAVEGQLQRFQSSWLSKYPWLTYSRSENGGYCAYCLAFASSAKSRAN